MQIWATVSMQISKSFDKYKISIRTVNYNNGPNNYGYNSYKVIECYYQNTIVAHLHFFEMQTGYQNTYDAGTDTMTLYFQMNRFNDIYYLI